jgi:GMP synthase (glutamine-hydrolysing)
MAGPRILVVEHEDSCPPALFGDWLAEAGCVLQVCRPYAGDALPALASYDGVLVLGGEMGANDDATHRWLAPLKAGIRDAVETGTPLLGICLGHQLVAAALGGVVERNPLGQTVGLQPVGWTEEAAGDDWVGGHRGGERAIHWNNDVVVSLPDGAVVLARSHRGGERASTTAPSGRDTTTSLFQWIARSPGGEVQIARFGSRAWGIQAHPEAHVGIIRRWLETDREDEVARDVDEEAVLAAIEAAGPELVAHWQPLAARFARLVAGRARPRSAEAGR